MVKNVTCITENKTKMIEIVSRSFLSYSPVYFYDDPNLSYCIVSMFSKTKH